MKTSTNNLQKLCKAFRDNDIRYGRDMMSWELSMEEMKVHYEYIKIRIRSWARWMNRRAPYDSIVLSDLDEMVDNFVASLKR